MEYYFKLKLKFNMYKYTLLWYYKKINKFYQNLIDESQTKKLFVVIQ